MLSCFDGQEYLSLLKFGEDSFKQNESGCSDSPERKLPWALPSALKALEWRGPRANSGGQHR